MSVHTPRTKLALVTVSAVLAILALQLSAATAEAQAPPVAGPSQPPLRIMVNESTYKLKVYSDGAVKPFYAATAIIEIPQLEASTKLSLELNAESTATKNSSRTLVSLKGLVEGAEVKAEHFSLIVRLRGGYNIREGTGSFTMSGHVSLENRTGKGSLELEQLTIKIPSHGKGEIIVDAIVQGFNFKPNASRAMTPDEINRRLRAKGLDYFRVEEIGAVLAAGNKTRIHFKASLDLYKMLERARENGLSEADAEKIKKLIEAKYNIKGGFSMALEARAEPGEARLSYNYNSSSQGEIEKAEKLGAETAAAMQKLIIALLTPLSQENPQTLLVLNQLRNAAGQVSPLVKAPPTTSRLQVAAKTLGPGRFMIKVSYEGHRQRVIGAEDPALAAEKTLTIMAMSYRQLVNQIGMLELIAPGISQLLPTDVSLVGEKGVLLSAKQVPFTRLPTVHVKIAKPTTTTTTATATKTATETATKTTTTTTTTTTKTATAVKTTTKTTTTTTTKTATTTTKTVAETQAAKTTTTKTKTATAKTTSPQKTKTSTIQQKTIAATKTTAKTQPTQTTASKPATQLATGTWTAIAVAAIVLVAAIIAGALLRGR